MNTLDLNKIIENEGLNTKQVASELFPTNKYPKLALDRVLKGEAFLDTNQVSKLSMLTGLPIQKLYSAGEWKSTCSPGIIKFTSGEYTAELNLEKNLTKVYHKDSIFHESILHKGSIPLSEYLDEINKLISKHSK